jgi:hypothetical protein
MDKQKILDLIKESADKAGGAALGARTFYKQYGLTDNDIRKYWDNYNDAVEEAGYPRNEPLRAYEKEEILSAYLSLVIKEKGKFPWSKAYARRTRGNPDLPAAGTLTKRFPRKYDLLLALKEYVSEHETPDEILTLIDDELDSAIPPEVVDEAAGLIEGYVYLMKSGKSYRIGRSSDPDFRRVALDRGTVEETTEEHRRLLAESSGYGELLSGRMAA